MILDVFKPILDVFKPIIDVFTLILDVRELIFVKIYRIISILIIWVKKEIFGSLQKFVSKRNKFVSKKQLPMRIIFSHTNGHSNVIALTLLLGMGVLYRILLEFEQTF